MGNPEMATFVTANMITSMAIPLILLLCIISFFLNKRGRVINTMFQGPLALPLVGNVYLAVRTLEGMHQYMFSKCKEFNHKTFRVWLFHNPCIAVPDYQVAKMILSSNLEIDKSREYRIFEPWVGKGIFTDAGERWRRHRKLITPAFHFKTLQSFFKVFCSNANLLVEKLEAHDGKEAFDVYNYITRLSLDNICGKCLLVRA